MALPDHAARTESGLTPLSFPYIDSKNDLDVPALVGKMMTPQAIIVPKAFRRATIKKIVCGESHWLVLVQDKNAATKVYSVGLGNALGLGDQRGLEGSEFESLTDEEKVRNDGSRNNLRLVRGRYH